MDICDKNFDGIQLLTTKVYVSQILCLKKDKKKCNYDWSKFLVNNLEEYCSPGCEVPGRPGYRDGTKTGREGTWRSSQDGTGLHSLIPVDFGPAPFPGTWRWDGMGLPSWSRLPPLSTVGIRVASGSVGSEKARAGLGLNQTHFTEPGLDFFEGPGRNIK